MAKEKFAFLPTTGKKTTLGIIFLVSNAFAWYYVVINFLSDILKDNPLASWVWLVHFCGIIFSALLGTYLTKKVGGRSRFLTLWMILGIISSFAVMLVSIADISIIVLTSLFLGISLGLGMPNCMGYFNDYVSLENRGKMAGIIILFSGIGMLGLGLFLSYGITVVSFVLILWRTLALAVFRFAPLPREDQKKQIDKSSYRSIFSKQSFLLYFVPWVMFSLVNYLATPIVADIIEEGFFAILIMIQTGLTAVFALIGGLFVDSIGRKRVAMIGFAMLGIGYAVLGLYPYETFSWFFNIVTDGIAWGLFFVTFVVTIWGDLSYTEPSDKYYAVGVLPFFISKLLELLIGSNLSALVTPTALFSFIAFFLFIAVLPLVYAPETLPERKIRERELKNYIDKARKTKEKYI
jgi:MFS family permease